MGVAFSLPKVTPNEVLNVDNEYYTDEEYILERPKGNIFFFLLFSMFLIQISVLQGLYLTKLPQIICLLGVFQDYIWSYVRFISYSNCSNWH